jgi:type IV pilus assembly protein PilF
LHWVAVGMLLGVASCLGSAAKAPRQDRERIAETEYDLARDLWLNKNQPREALDHALKASKLDEHNAEVAHLVALLYLDFCSQETEECRLDTAETEARRAVKLDANFREARNTLGVILIHGKKYQEAVEVLKPLTADILYSTPEKAWGNLGWAYLELGRTEEAIDEGCQSLQTAFAARGRVLSEIGDATGARADLERCVELEHRNDTGKECSSMLQKLK